MQPWDCKHCTRKAECMKSVLTRGVDEGIIGDYVGGELARAQCESRVSSYVTIETRMDDVQKIIEQQSQPITVPDILAVYDVNETILQQVLSKLRNDNRVYARRFYSSNRKWFYFHKPIDDSLAPRSMTDTIRLVAEHKKAGMSMVQTAKLLGIHAVTVSKYRCIAKEQGLLP